MTNLTDGDFAVVEYEGELEEANYTALYPHSAK